MNQSKINDFRIELEKAHIPIINIVSNEDFQLIELNEEFFIEINNESECFRLASWEDEIYFDYIYDCSDVLEIIDFTKSMIGA